MICRQHVALGYAPCLFIALVASCYPVTATTNASSTIDGILQTSSTITTVDTSEATTQVETTTTTVIAPPPSPTGLISFPLSSSAIKLIWNGTSEADGYGIKWQVYNDTNDIETKEENVTNSTVTVSGLRAWTTYNFSVVAIKDGVASQPATTESTTHPDAPCPPNSIELRQLNNTNSSPNVSVNWSKPNCTNGPLDGYQVSWTNEDSNEESNFTLDSTSTSTTISSLQPWINYTFSVLAYNDFQGERLASRAVNSSLRTYPSEPGAPINVTLQFTETSVNAEWLPPDPPNGDIDGYMVSLMKGYCGQGESKEDRKPIYEREYSETNLHPATNYSFSVSAFNTWEGERLIGEENCQDFRTYDDYPSSPSNVTCTAINSTAIFISWEEPQPMLGEILNYSVYYRINAHNTDMLSNISTFSKYLVLEELEPYTQYFIRVSAWTSKGEGNWSAPQHCNTTVAAPCRLQNIKLTQENKYSEVPVVLVEWEEPSSKNGPLDGYKILWRKENGYDIGPNYTKETSFDVGNLQPWTEYTFSVSAYNTFGDEELESEAVNASLKTTPSEPGLPINLTFIADETSVCVNWLPPNPTNGIIAGYNITLKRDCEYNKSNNGWETINGTEYCNENLRAATNYSFSVYAFIKHEETILNGPVECQDFRTDDGNPSRPSNLMCTEEGSSFIIVSWDEPEEYHGEILNYTVNYWGHQSRNSVISGTTPDRNVTLDQLEPYTKYEIIVSAWTSKGQGNWSAPVTCMTTSAVPNAPSDVSTQRLNSTAIYVKWVATKPYPGPTTYHIITETLGDNCGKTSGRPIANQTTKGEHIYIAGLQPFTEYGVRIIAETYAGPSKPTYVEKARTSPSEPEAVQNLELDCSINSSTVLISWLPPRRANGILESYRIEYIGNKGEKEDGRKEERLKVKDPCKKDKVTTSISGLLPEYKYTFEVSAKVADVRSYGKSTKLYCYLPAGYPPPPQKNISVLEGLKEKIIFVLQNDTFLETEGDIIEYAVVVAEAKNIGTNESGGRTSEKLPNWSEFQNNGSVLRYQATPEDWNPFWHKDPKDDPLKCEGGKKNVTCTLGCQAKCDINSYCNGPLRPGMSYGFKIRGYTKTGFAETLPVVIRTKTEPVSDSWNTLTAVIVTIVVVSALGVAVFLYYRYGAARAHQLIIRLSPRRFVKSTVMPKTSRTSSPPPNDVVSFTSNIMVTHTRPVRLSEFSRHVSFMMSDSTLKFSQEFEELKSISPSHPCTAAQLPDNRPKNRWINILPFDHSRVKLLPIDDEPASDYINASYIPGFTCHREYIASQGPLPGTVDDMWRMIWEQGVNMIVMLTQCVERGKTKCEQYWPAEKQSTTYGDLQVLTMSESVLSEYTIRTFDLSLGSRHRVITHLHFTKWPDFGCPENTELLINFVRAVRDHMSEDDPNPLLVHCSAGVGRTGTFIAVDRLMQHVLVYDYADIFQSVLDMREHRTNMVQTEDQYIYIHECVRDLVQDKLARERDSLKDELIYDNVDVNSTTKV